MLHVRGVARPGKCKYLVRRMLLAVGLPRSKTRGKWDNTERREARPGGASTSSPEIHADIASGTSIVNRGCVSKRGTLGAPLHSFLLFLSSASLTQIGIRCSRHRHGRVLLGIGPRVANGLGEGCARTLERERESTSRIKTTHPIYRVRTVGYGVIAAWALVGPVNLEEHTSMLYGSIVVPDYYGPPVQGSVSTLNYCSNYSSTARKNTHE